MLRTRKLVMAAAVALALHVAMLFWVFAPHLSELVQAYGTSTEPSQASAPASAETIVAERRGPAVVADEEPMDVDWPLAEDEPEPQQEPPKAKRAEKAPAPIIAAAPAASGAEPGQPSPPVAAPLPVTGAHGDSTAVIAADSDYANRVRQHLARFAGALPPGVRGEARVQFVVQRDGRVTDVQLVRRSGHEELDALALSLPRNAQPLPLPGAVPQRLEVPVQAATAP